MNNTGPRESSFTARAISASKGDNNTRAILAEDAVLDDL